MIEVGIAARKGEAQLHFLGGNLVDPHYHFVIVEIFQGLHHQGHGLG